MTKIPEPWIEISSRSYSHGTLDSQLIFKSFTHSSFNHCEEMREESLLNCTLWREKKKKRRLKLRRYKIDGKKIKGERNML